MNKAELVKAIGSKHGLKDAQAREIVETTLETIVGAVRSGDKVDLHGFGTFKAHTRPAGKSRNPRTGATIDRAAKTKLTFKPVPSLSVAG